MNNTTKGIIAGTMVAAAGLTAGIVLKPLDDLPPTPPAIVESQDYDQIKRSILSKIQKNEPLTWQEYQWAVTIYDYEIKRQGGLSYKDVNDKEKLFDDITNDIK